jgi:hypothetical protein
LKRTNHRVKRCNIDKYYSDDYGPCHGIRVGGDPE